VIKCPHPECNKFNYINKGQYSMGDLFSCKECKTVFQQLACPHCFESNYWRGDIKSFYSAGINTTCYACKKTFQQLLCPHCKCTKYFKNSDYTCGVKQQCNNCKKHFQHVLCNSCKHPTYYAGCEFKYGAPQTCSNSGCKQEFELIICPECGGENFKKGSRGTENKFIKDDCCSKCNAKFSHHSCQKCKEIVYLNNFTNGVNKFKCPSCRMYLDDFYKCETCHKISVNSSNCKQCPRPQSISQSIFGTASSNTTNGNLPVLFGGLNNSSNYSSRLNANSSPVFGSLFFGGSQTQTMNQSQSGSIFGGHSTQLISQNQPRSIFGSVSNTKNKAPEITPINLSKSPANDPKPKTVENNNNNNLPSSEESKQCVICMDLPAEIAFIPCGHKKTCLGCSKTLMKGKSPCPICRNPIQNTMRIFE